MSKGGSVAKNTASELVWQGRIHLGDEPGVYGDAHYAGLCAEIPLTVVRSDPTSGNDLAFTLVIEAEDVGTFAGYDGHEIVVRAYDPDPNPPYRAAERELGRFRLTSQDNGRKELVLQTGTTTTPSVPLSVSVQLRIDTKVNPGLYDDFVWNRLSFSCADFKLYASLGFRS